MICLLAIPAPGAAVQQAIVPADDPRLGHPMLAAAMEQAADGIMITNGAGVVEWVNPAFSNLTGYSRSEVIGKNPRILKSGSSPPELYKSLWRTILQGQPWHGKMVNRRKDGSCYTEEMTITPLRDPAGTISHFVAIKQDITGRAKAEQELRSSCERLELGLEVSNQGFWDWDLATDEASLTAGFRRLLGYEEDEDDPRRRGGFGLIHPNDLAGAEQALMEHLSGHSQRYEAEVRLRKKNGEYLPVLSRGKAMSDASGRPLRVVGIHSDATGRLELEQQLRQAQKMETLGLLSGGIAHDFNNLLTVINGYGQMLMSESRLSAEGRESLGLIRDAGERAAALVRQLLAFSRRTAQEVKIVDLNEVVAEMTRLLGRLLPANIRFTNRLEPDLGMVLANPGLIQQALMNLVVNARDAMPQGGTLVIETTNLRLSVSERHPDVPAGDCILITVSDTGAGMDDATQQHVFEPFYTTKPVGAGAGLGLSIVRDIVNQSGGLISIDSQEGKGASVKIYLPRVDGELAQAGVSQGQAPRGGHETILVVEDSAQVRRFMRVFLENLGYAILEADSAEQAMAVSLETARPIDLLVTDFVLPDSTGPDIARQLTESRPELAILYISGYAQECVAGQQPANPGIEFLQKPFTGDALALRVQEILRKRQRRRVLILSDDRAVTLFATQVLSQAGFDVLTAADGRSAVSIVKNQSLDLVMADLVMPMQQGVETFLAVRRSMPSLPIVAISGTFGGQFVKAALSFGAQAAVTKPFTAEKLLEAVRDALRAGPAVP